ncbi:MAG: isoaspartyl peptidase/L-asparaginase [Chlorobi bacterium]|nr:isoaspartyl peptidase/L-asparaginase [Chlorobiota bacterium]
MNGKKITVLIFILSLSIALVSGCTKKIAPEESGEKVVDFALVIHGGAGAMKKGLMSEEKEKAYKAKLTEALNVGYKILNEGGTSLDAVEKVINLLEDSPLFNAGKGAVFNSEGMNELDASIMNGKDKTAGAVAGVHHIKNPISLARLVMEKSPHVLMAGEGAEKFAVENGVKLVDTSYFFTESRWESLQRVKKIEKLKNPIFEPAEKKESKFGTVGCVALDKAGNLAAGTSTGGMTNKKYGRIGDSPIIGAGTYADNNTCAVSCTGHGEYFIRYVVAYDITALMKYKNMSVEKASDEVINKKLKAVGGSGGVIAIDKEGNIAMPFNTSGMFRGYVTDKNEPEVKIYDE